MKFRKFEGGSCSRFRAEFQPAGHKCLHKGGQTEFSFFLQCQKHIFLGQRGAMAELAKG